MSGPFYEPCHCPHGVRWGLILMGQLEILIGKVFNYQDYYIYKDSVADLIITVYNSADFDVKNSELCTRQ